MAEQLYNTLSSTVNQANGVCDTDTTIQLADTGLFPTTVNYRIVIDDEIMLVTSNVAGLLTVTRSVEGTTATAHANGATVLLQLTAGGLIQYISEH